MHPIAPMDWDLSAYFDAFDSETYRRFKRDLHAALTALREQVAAMAAAGSRDPRDWECLVAAYEDFVARYSHLRSYLSCLVSADAANPAYLAEEAALAQFDAQRAILQDQLIRLVGKLDEAAFASLQHHRPLQDAAAELRRLRHEAGQRMDAELEALRAELGVDGISAWSRLYFTAVGNLRFRMEDPESGLQEVPFAQYNSLLNSPVRARRQAAQRGAAAALEAQQHTFASALNAISGTRLTVNRRRGIGSFLEPGLRQSRIRGETLEAMLAAIRAALPFARDVFRYRSLQLGISDPGYADLRAPLDLGRPQGLDWQAATDLIERAFRATYPALADFFAETVALRHVDYQPRAGKRPGGFCSTSLKIRQSRIFMNYHGTLADVLTLAHEAGHAWHSRVLAQARPLAAGYPMTIAETASTFAERILTAGVLQDRQQDELTQLILLDAEMEHMLAFLLDLPVRFLFEREVYRRRADGSLSPQQLCDLMRDTQREVFGDALAAGGEDPWFWASKLHFYINEVEFYNYPYTFGYLLSAGLMERLQAEGSNFLDRYERFLALSGQLDCEELIGQTFAADPTHVGFWSSLIRPLESCFAAYKEHLERYRNRG